MVTVCLCHTLNICLQVLYNTLSKIPQPRTDRDRQSKHSTYGRMASSKVCLLAALCSFVILSTFIANTQAASCCLRYTKHPLPCKRLIGYTIQNINTSCDIDAIVFHLPGRFVCANPQKQWTQQRMKCVDEMMKKKHVNQEGTSSNPSSASQNQH